MKHWISRLAAASLGIVLLGWFAFDQWVARTELPDLNVEGSITVLDRNGTLLRAYSVADGRWRLPLTLDQVDPDYIDQLVAFEDKRFFDHNGVDPRAVLRAVGQALWNRRVISGGSTLTMQVARLLEDGETGQWPAKFRQLRVALALERQISKEEILNLYLNLAPMGGNIEGVRAASLTYFGKEPRRLTPAQAALMVALPQAPTSRRPDRNTYAARIARDRVLTRMIGAGVLPEDEVTAAYGETVPSVRIPFPILAPHLADRLLREFPDVQIHKTTLDRNLQTSLETMLQSSVSQENRNLSGAIIVVNHQTGEILASLGSSNFFDMNRHGFVDMTRAIRSPGSTLKPLIYGLAFEAGLAHPETLIEDRPTSFNGYTPTNFDRTYRGTVHIRTALQLSLNIPAVATLDAIGPAHFMNRLRRAGAHPQLPPGDRPGLAIALGGLGVSLHDLVSLYVAIARGGEPITLSNTREGSTLGNPVLSPTAAWYIGDILAGSPPPETGLINNIAFKTGTSYGHRDAWAIGFDGRHVIGVWLGRPDGTAVPGIQGLKTAAPILFDAFSHLKSEPDLLPVAPRSTLTVTHSELPSPLQIFRSRGQSIEDTQNYPQISYPPDGAQVVLGSEDALIIKLRNGTPPFTWIINGTPQNTSPFEHQTIWRPEGQGFVRVSVIDGRGHSANAVYFLEIP